MAEQDMADSMSLEDAVVAAISSLEGMNSGVLGPVNPASKHKMAPWGMYRTRCLLNDTLEIDLCGDTGTGVTLIPYSVAVKGGLVIRPPPAGHKAGRTTTVDGSRELPFMGFVDVPITMLLNVRLDASASQGETDIVWHRRFVLRNVRVYDIPNPRMDLLVAWEDFAFDLSKPIPADRPLAELAYMLMNGATVLNTPRAPPKGVEVPTVRMRSLTGAELHDRMQMEAAAVGVAAIATDESEGLNYNWKGELHDRLSERYRGSPVEARLVAALSERDGSGKHRHRVFGPIVHEECSLVVEFEVLEGMKPQRVSWQVRQSKKVPQGAMAAALAEWEKRGVCRRVPPDTPAYGFAMLVPKPNGKFRLTINPTGINKATKRIQLKGGFMPSSILQEAQRAGRRKLAITLDLREAFLVALLGPTAAELSVFSTTEGKYQWIHGWFGWHSFPAWFQQTIMERVILPTVEKFGYSVATLLAWIDDLVITGDSEEELLDVFLFMVDRILDIGGRLSIEKCNFFVTRFDWCGIEVDLETNQYRVAAARVASLEATPIPVDRTALQHVLGVLRYYFFTVADHNLMRERLAKLEELDVKGIVLTRAWTDAHTDAMKGAFRAIASGDWIMVYDPSRPIFIQTDASGNDGYCVVVNQFDDSGKPRPVAYWSHGWSQPALDGWTPQVKECYAQRQAVCYYLPKYFPYATDVILLCDNKNLSADIESADAKVKRWKLEMACEGITEVRWVPGEWNTVADYGSRVARPTGVDDDTLPPWQRYELGIFAIAVSSASSSTEEPKETVVYGHKRYTPLIGRIIDAQEAAPAEERAAWNTANHSTATLGGRTFTLFKRRILVPKNAEDIKTELLEAAHDEQDHYLGAERMVFDLQRARIHWEGIHEDARDHTRSCVGCQFGKAQSREPDIFGELEPTTPPSVHHTWYTDFKGPLPNGGGYILAVTEAVTRVTKLRHVKSTAAATVIPVMDSVAREFMTYPKIIRSDNGPPYDSQAWRDWCSRYGVTPVLGVPHHSQGQGMVETRFRSVTDSMLANLGYKLLYRITEEAVLGRMEWLLNTTVCEPIGMSPAKALLGAEPRTAFTSAVSFTEDEVGEKLFGCKAITAHDIQEVLADHHNHINAIQQLASVASNLAQAMTKRKWDSGRKKGDFKVGQYVLVYRAAPNRLRPDFIGPYIVTAVRPGGSFVSLKHFLQEDSVIPEIGVGRLIPFDATRATKADLVTYQLEAGQFVVTAIKEHRVLENGSYEFHVEWMGTDVTSWELSRNVKRVQLVQEYCQRHGLESPGTETKRKATAAGGAGGAGGAAGDADGLRRSGRGRKPNRR